MRFFTIALVVCLLFGCRSSHREYLDNLQPIKRTDKELKYIELLKSRGFSNVKLEIQMIGLGAYGTQTYYIKMDTPFDLTIKNADSVIRVRRGIAIEMYKSVVEDSIINDCRDFDVIFRYQKYEINPYDYSLLSDHILKDSLATWCGFKVVADGKDRFKRVPM
jgi:hypothetical protein